MSRYKVTGRNSEKETLIVEELKAPDEPIKHLREIIGKKQKPKGGSPNPHRQFFLEDKSGKRFSEQGIVLYFQKKKQAKRIRNHLNSKFGHGAYKIVPLDKPDITKFVLDKEEEIARLQGKLFGFIPFPPGGYDRD